MFYGIHDFGIVQYLSQISSFNLRKRITTIRVSSHNLFIETLRFGRERKETYDIVCIFCETGDIEDEFNLICKCSFYSNIRIEVIDKYYITRPNSFKFTKLLSPTTN